MEFLTTMTDDQVLSLEIRMRLGDIDITMFPRNAHFYVLDEIYNRGLEPKQD